MEITHIEFKVNQHTWSIGGSDPEDSWSRDSTDGHVTIESARISDVDGHHMLSIGRKISNGDTVYLVWAQYSTGDSFGTDGAQYELLEVLTDREEAQNRAEFYKTVTDYSVPWTGYFESLDGIYVESFVVGEP